MLGAFDKVFKDVSWINNLENIYFKKIRYTNFLSLGVFFNFGNLTSRFNGSIYDGEFIN